ncbi:DUF3883 domain-containing protein, partial [Salmonella enterica]|nr:DUF3883 domain-containing protein [Salmonella enterica]ECR7642544.1 DUF3883 domain-containing protein [Salmonella enterica]EEJ5033815.1 DUF3883 domain-containing protein [Salmonella enterica subsp. enterica serovar Anatum]
MESRMTKFVAIKIHYDHRKSLTPYLKYSKVPTPEEYQEYLNLFHDEGIGGAGFHECLNFAIREHENTKIYLPPTCIPNSKYMDEDFVFFSFTYKHDKEMPSSIIGVHAATKIHSIGKEPLLRDDIEPIEGAEPFYYHAEAPSDFITLFTPAIEYDYREGLFTPIYKSWGNGLRYINEDHATNIINTVLKEAQKRRPNASISEEIIISREIRTLESIQKKYGLTSDDELLINKGKTSNREIIPDREIGFLGEKVVYEEEINYAIKHKIPISEVEWISQSDPQSPYDIKTIRIINNKKREHFIEVKSSRIIDESNIYLSSRQVKFFQENESSSTFKFVTFTSQNTVNNIRELNFNQLSDEFDLVP